MSAQLPGFVRALLHPDAYPHLTGRVRLIQTHISYVLLAGDYVYKVKKPVDFGFLDFSTLPKRRYYCRREVVLNSRLCPDAYLGVAQIRDAAGRIVVGGRQGRIIEYAVHMRRLPEERMMDRLLEAGRVAARMVERVAERLAEFHALAETSRRIAQYGDRAIRYNWRENEAQWAPYIGRALSPEQDGSFAPTGKRSSPGGRPYCAGESTRFASATSTPISARTPSASRMVSASSTGRSQRLRRWPRSKPRAGSVDDGRNSLCYLLTPMIVAAVAVAIRVPARTPSKSKFAPGLSPAGAVPVNGSRCAGTAALAGGNCCAGTGVPVGAAIGVAVAPGVIVGVAATSGTSRSTIKSAPVQTSSAASRMKASSGGHHRNSNLTVVGGPLLHSTGW